MRFATVTSCLVLLAVLIHTDHVTSVHVDPSNPRAAGGSAAQSGRVPSAGQGSQSGGQAGNGNNGRHLGALIKTAIAEKKTEKTSSNSEGSEEARPDHIATIDEMIAAAQKEKKERNGQGAPVPPSTDNDAPPPAGSVQGADAPPPAAPASDAAPPPAQVPAEVDAEVPPPSR